MSPISSFTQPGATRRDERGITTALGVAGAVVLVVIIIAVAITGSYNGLVKKQNFVEQQFAQIDVVLERRYDLIPNLVNAVRGALQQEQEVFGQIAEARTRYAGNPTAENANQVESALSRLLVIVEQYPQLQSNQNIQALQAELAGTENRIAVERRRYNEVATDYNNAVETMPRAIVANLFGFDSKELLNAPEAARTAPTVDLGVTTTAPAPATSSLTTPPPAA